MKAISLSQSLIATIVGRFCTWLDNDNQVLSELMEESVSNRQTLLVSQAILSGIILLCSAYTCIEAVLLLLCWFAISVLLCERGGRL